MRSPLHPARWLGLCALAAVLAAAAPAQVQVPDVALEEADEYALPQVSDPFQRFNRTIFKFNDTAQRRVLRPIGRAYESAVPEKARRGIGNFFDNLKFPVRLAGSLLQGKIDRAARETGKFLINSTLGVGGFIKTSDRVADLRDVPSEDVGQALGKWGLPTGPYLVLPLLGPATPRDLVGRVADGQLTPYNWSWANDYEWEWGVGLSVGDTFQSLPELTEAYEAITASAVDPYIAVRNGYLGFRAAAIAR